MQAAKLALLLCCGPAFLYSVLKREHPCRNAGFVCLQPWDLALVLEFPGDASHPEDIGKIGRITRFVMEVRAVYAPPDVVRAESLDCAQDPDNPSQA